MSQSLRRRLLAGERLAAIFVQTPSVAVVEVLGTTGVDVLCLDQEHSALGPETVQSLVAGSAGAGVPALVRVADAAPPFVAAALDAGAAGVLVPRVSSGAAAAAVVRAARYPPAGERGAGPGRAAAYGRRIAEALAQANEDVLVGVQVETRAGLAALDDILATEGVDLVFIGPGDLSVALGLVGGMRDPELLAIARDVVARAAAAGRLTGAFAPDVELARTWQSLGVNLLVVGSDLAFLSDAVEAACRSLRAEG